VARRDDGQVDTAIPGSRPAPATTTGRRWRRPGQQWPTPAPDADEADPLEHAQEVLADPDEEYAPNPRVRKCSPHPLGRQGRVVRLFAASRPC